MEDMSEQDYFRNALSDFTYEAASGGAIRHLADLGYTVKQISEKLTYPTPYEKVRKTTWQHLIDTQVVLTQEPGSGKQPGKAIYTVTHDKYGRAGFCMETTSTGDSDRIHWKERCFSREHQGSLAVYLADKCGANGEDGAYISCDFGLQYAEAKDKFAATMEVLNGRQKEYIEGLMWEKKICYHRLDRRMQEIIVRLHTNGLYRGYCYFIKLEEKVEII